MENQGLVLQMFCKGGEMGYNSPKVIMNKYVRADGLSALHLQVIINRQKTYIPLGIFVRPENFDMDTRKIKRSDPRHSEYNLVIDAEMSKAVEIFIEFTLMRQPYDLQTFLKRFHHWDTRIDFIVFFEKNLDARKHTIAKGTIDRQMNTLNKLKSFRSKIPFYELTPELIMQFDAYMKVELKNNSTTRHINHRLIHYYIRLAIQKNDIRIKDPYTGYKLPEEKTRLVYLTQQELKKIIDYYDSDACTIGNRTTLNAFLLMCFTSIRIGDLMKLTTDNIMNDHIVLNPEKTRNTKRGDNTVMIPINGEAKKYIVPYNGYLVKPVQEQHINRQLKEVCEILSINKRVTNHVARHTFATIYLERGGDLATLQKIMGHSSIEQTMVYSHISNTFKKDQMMKVFSDFTQ